MYIDRKINPPLYFSPGEPRCSVNSWLVRRRQDNTYLLYFAVAFCTRNIFTPIQHTFIPRLFFSQTAKLQLHYWQPTHIQPQFCGPEHVIVVASLYMSVSCPVFIFDSRFCSEGNELRSNTWPPTGLNLSLSCEMQRDLSGCDQLKQQFANFLTWE